MDKKDVNVCVCVCRVIFVPDMSEKGEDQSISDAYRDSFIAHFFICITASQMHAFMCSVKQLHSVL